MEISTVTSSFTIEEIVKGLPSLPKRLECFCREGAAVLKGVGQCQQSIHISGGEGWADDWVHSAKISSEQDASYLALLDGTCTYTLVSFSACSGIVPYLNFHELS